MSRYAKQTTVTPAKSRAEIESIITRYGADQFAYGWQDEQAMIQFRFERRVVRFVLTMPDRDDDEFSLTPAGRRRRSTDGTLKEWEKACRQIWRALALVVKAKLEAVESGIVTFDEEFLPYLLLPDGTTVASNVIPVVIAAYETGRMPSTLLLGMGETP